MKNFAIYLGVLFVFMFLVPWAVVQYMADAAMPVCFMLFYMVNPMLSAIVGAYSGVNIKTAWFYPMLLAIAFLGGVWISFETTEPMFAVYSVTYIIIGYLVTLIAFIIKKILKK